MIKVLIPIAGKDGNESQSQYIRTLYEIEKKTIMQHVYESLNQIKEADFIVILRHKDIINYHLDDMIKLMVPGVKIVVANGDTAGAACSCLLAIDEICESEPLIISGSDQLLQINLQDVIDDFQNRNLDGGAITFDDIHPRWSYLRLDDAGYVIEAAEKRPISRHATTGFYYYKKGGDFIIAVQNMIKKGAYVNGQYYVCPAFNEMVLAGKKIGTYEISKEDYFSLAQQKGVDDYERYLRERETR